MLKYHSDSMAKRKKRTQMEIKLDIELTSGQKEVYDYAHQDDIRQIVMCFSRQCGKTVIAEVLMLEWLCKYKTYNAYISPTFQLGRKVFSEMVKLLENTKIIKKANASTLTIETIFESTLQFFSVEGYTAIRGHTIKGLLVLDEAAYYPTILPNGETIWGNIVLPLLKSYWTRNKTLIISTPCGKQGFFYEYYQKALNGRQGIVQVTRTIYDDKLITSEQIQDIRDSIPSLAFQQEFECKFLDNALTFFSGFEKCFKEMTFNENSKTYIGIDPSGQGEDECIVTKLNEHSQVKQYVIKGSFDEKYKQIADIINSTRQLENCLVEINGLGHPMFNEIRKQVKRKFKVNEFSTTNASKERIISNLATLIEQEKITFDKNDTSLFSQFSTFQATYTKNKHLQLQARQGYHDDRVLSLAMAVEAMNTTTNITSKSNFGFGLSKDTFIG